MNFDKILENARKYVIELIPAEVNKLILEKDVVLIDVREQNEIVSGYIENSILIPRGLLEQKIFKLVTDFNKKMILYSNKGVRSLLAAKTLIDLGYVNVFSMHGGIEECKKQGYKYLINLKQDLTAEQKIRYSKQILLPEISIDGQIKLMNSKILVIGTGGLASSCLYYLASAGIGTIGIVDYKKVDLSNLYKEILYNTNDIGKDSVETAKEVLNNLNPDINIITYNIQINNENILNIIKDYDLIIDGTDNIPTKYLINDACYFSNKPYLYASIFKFDGHIILFDTKNNTACLRCLYSSNQNKFGDCEKEGVLGSLAGIIGSIQATEAIKFILNKGKLLLGKLLIYDSFSTNFYNFHIRKNDLCKLCGLKTIKNLEYNKENT